MQSASRKVSLFSIVFDPWGGIVLLLGQGKPSLETPLVVLCPHFLNRNGEIAGSLLPSQLLKQRPVYCKDFLLRGWTLFFSHCFGEILFHILHENELVSNMYWPSL